MSAKIVQATASAIVFPKCHYHCCYHYHCPAFSPSLILLVNFPWSRQHSHCFERNLISLSPVPKPSRRALIADCGTLRCSNLGCRPLLRAVSGLLVGLTLVYPTHRAHTMPQIVLINGAARPGLVCSAPAHH